MDTSPPGVAAKAAICPEALIPVTMTEAVPVGVPMSTRFPAALVTPMMKDC